MVVPPPAVPSVVSKVALLLRSVAAAEPDGITTSALARVAALNRSTAHRLLHELRAEGFIDRDDATAVWVVGPEMYLLGTAAGPRYDVTARAQPFVRQLAVATGESAFFSVRRGLETVCLVREDGSFPLRSHVLYEGVRFPLGVASAGLAILAFMSPREVETYINDVDLAATFGPQHALHFAQGLVRIASQFQRVRQHDEVEAGGGKRQFVELAAHRNSGPFNRLAQAVQRQPAVRHAVGLQRGKFRQPELQGMKAEQIGHGRIHMAALPIEQIAPWGCLQPLGQLYNRGFSCHQALSATHPAGGLCRQLHLDARQRS